jgi:large subunit ribosomal protein L30
MPRLRITQTRSTIGTLRAQRQTLRSLGLRRVRDVSERADDPSTRGMIATVSHLVRVEEVAK